MTNHINVIFCITIVQLLSSPDGCLSRGPVRSIVILCIWLLGEHEFCECELCSPMSLSWEADGTWKSCIMQQNFFSPPSHPDVASLRQNCAELLSRRTCKENRAVDYIKINYLQSCVTRSSLVWHFVPLSLFLQTEPKPRRMENQPLDVQLAAVFRVIMWITFDWMLYQLVKKWGISSMLKIQRLIC